MKFKSKHIKKDDLYKHDYYKVSKDYTQLKLFVKYMCISMVIIIFALAAYKAIKNDTTEIDAALKEVDYYINKTDFKSEDSLKAFAESFTDLYLSSDIDAKNRKEMIEQYVSNTSDIQIRYAAGTSARVKSTKLRNVEEVTDKLLNASVLARVEITTEKTDEITKEIEKTTKIKDYILKLPIKVTKTDREFSYLIYKSPSFDPLPEVGESYEGKFIKLTQMSALKTSIIESTVQSFLKVYFEGTDEEIKYFYVGSETLKGFKGEMKLEKVDTKVFEMKGSEDLIAYSVIEVSDEYASYKNSYEFKLEEKEGKWFIKNFGVKDTEITMFENEEE